MKGKREKGEGKNGLNREIERGKKNEKELFIYISYSQIFIFILFSYHIVSYHSLSPIILFIIFYYYIVYHILSFLSYIIFYSMYNNNCLLYTILFKVSKENLG